MVHASVVGAIDFKACDSTPRWWTGTLMRLRMVEHHLELKAAELHAQRAFGVQGMIDLGQDTDFRQTYALDAANFFRAKALPWLGDAKAQNRVGDPLDAIAEWYAVFGDSVSA